MPWLQAQFSFFPLPPNCMAKAVGINSQKKGRGFGFLLVSWRLCRSRLFFGLFGSFFFYFNSSHYRHTRTFKTQICKNQTHSPKDWPGNFPPCFTPTPMLVMHLTVFMDISHTGASPYVDKSLADITVFHQHNMFQLMSQNTLWYQYKWFLLRGGLLL